MFLREGVAHCGSSPKKQLALALDFWVATARIPTPKVFWVARLLLLEKLFGDTPKKIKNAKFAL